MFRFVWFAVDFAFLSLFSAIKSCWLSSSTLFVRRKCKKVVLIFASNVNLRQFSVSDEFPVLFSRRFRWKNRLISFPSVDEFSVPDGFRLKTEFGHMSILCFESQTIPAVRFELSGSNFNFSYYESYKKRIVKCHEPRFLAQY